MTKAGDPVRLSAGIYNRALELASKVHQGLSEAGDPPFYTTQALKIAEPGHHREAYVGYPINNRGEFVGCQLFELYHDTQPADQLLVDEVYLPHLAVRTFDKKVKAYNPEDAGTDVCDPEDEERCNLEPNEASRLPAGIGTWPGMVALYGVAVVGSCCDGTRHIVSPATPNRPEQTWWHECRPLASFMGQPWQDDDPFFYRWLNQACQAVLAHGDGFDIIKLGGPCGTRCNYLAVVRRFRWFCENNRTVICPTAFTIVQPVHQPSISVPPPFSPFSPCPPAWWNMYDEPTNSWWLSMFLGVFKLPPLESCDLLVCLRGGQVGALGIRLCPGSSPLQIDSIPLSCDGGEADVGGSYYNADTGELALRFLGAVEQTSGGKAVCVYEICIKVECPPVVCWPANWTGVQ